MATVREQSVFLADLVGDLPTTGVKIWQFAIVGGSTQYQWDGAAWVTGWGSGGGATALTVEIFDSIANGTPTLTVSANAIADDDQWSVTVNGIEQVSRTSATSSANGNISIDHGTGVITFHNGLNAGDLVVVKYN